MTTPLTIMYEQMDYPRHSLRRNTGTVRIVGHVTRESFAEQVLPILHDVTNVIFQHCNFESVVLELPKRPTEEKVDNTRPFRDKLPRQDPKYPTLVNVKFQGCNFMNTKITGHAGSIVFRECTTDYSYHSTNMPKETLYDFEHIPLVLDVKTVRTTYFDQCIMDVSITYNDINNYNFNNFVGHMELLLDGDEPDMDTVHDFVKDHCFITNCNSLRVHGHRAFLSVFNMGREQRTVTYNAMTDEVVAGCFSGTVDEFEEEVANTYSREKTYTLEGMRKHISMPIKFLERCEKEYNSVIVLFRGLREHYLAKVEVDKGYAKVKLSGVNLDGAVTGRYDSSANTFVGLEDTVGKVTTALNNLSAEMTNALKGEKKSDDSDVDSGDPVVEHNCITLEELEEAVDRLKAVNDNTRPYTLVINGKGYLIKSDEDLLKAKDDFIRTNFYVGVDVANGSDQPVYMPLHKLSVTEDNKLKRSAIEREKFFTTDQEVDREEE